MLKPGMNARLQMRIAIACCVATLAGSMSSAPLAAAEPSKYPTMAPIEQYRIASQADEVALARSAAPPSISTDAEVLVLGERAYQVAAKGKNGFVCIVERSWASDPGDPEFWNPKERSPNCFNPPAARSVLPTYLERTKWVLAGATDAEILRRTKADIASGKIHAPEVGAMCYMMSKDGYLNDSAGGHWHPHLMFYMPRVAGNPPDWGANLPGSPVLGGDAGLEPAAVYFVPVSKWSDGSPGAANM
jgi:hypothetical protein